MKEKMDMQPTYYIGIMSGTSLDGIDIALVDIKKHSIKLIASDIYIIPESLRQNLLMICQQKQVTLQQLGEVDHQLGLVYAETVNKFINKYQIDKNKICAIGCHGQTIYHSPVGQFPFTMQIGDANIIAAKTAITTIADFRRKDMAFGGQGAPLVPAFHQALFADSNKNRVIVNIGGISNISVLAPDQPVIGFDTGPGNVLLDSWIQYHLNQHYDRNGDWAKSGQIHSVLLSRLLDESYFDLPYPKSTGRELFNLAWLQNKLVGLTINPQDVQATLAEFTAQTIANEVNKLKLNQLDNQLLLCGGGSKNLFINQILTKHLPKWIISTTDEYGISSDYMEAMAFAWLAYCCINHIPSNMPSVTGAEKAVSLGVIYPK